MPENATDQSENPGDETRDERRRAPSSNDRDRHPEPGEAKSRLQHGHDVRQGEKSHDTDPDSPDADIDRDDMIDEA